MNYQTSSLAPLKLEKIKYTANILSAEKVVDIINSLSAEIDKKDIEQLKKHIESSFVHLSGDSNVGTLTLSGSLILSNDITVAKSIQQGSSIATGLSSCALGVQTSALMNGAVAEGFKTRAEGQYSHAEGYQTVISANYSHAEGNKNTIYAANSHAEGAENIIQPGASYSHAEGFRNTISAKYSHAEGANNKILTGAQSHAEGSGNTINNTGHVEGIDNTINGSYSHAEGKKNKTYSNYSHVEGQMNIVGCRGYQINGISSDFQIMQLSSITGIETGWTYSCHLNTPSGGNYMNFGKVLSAYVVTTPSTKDPTKFLSSYYISVDNCPAEAYTSKGFLWFIDHPEVGNDLAGQNAHAEGSYNSAQYEDAHAEGCQNTAAARFSHAEGKSNAAIGWASHAEGNETSAVGQISHSSGYKSIAKHSKSFAWNGGSNFYESHGIGTFNVNPVNGLSGFYVGEQSLKEQMQNDINDIVNKKTSCFIHLSGDDDIGELHISSGLYADKLSKFKAGIYIGNALETFYAPSANMTFGLGQKLSVFGTNSIAVGSKCVAGTNVLSVIDMYFSDNHDNGMVPNTIKLDSIDGLSSGMTYLIKITSNYGTTGQILSVNTADRIISCDQIPSIAYSSFHKADGQIPVTGADKTTNLNVIWIKDHPEIGTIAYADGAHAEGIGTKATQDCCHAEGNKTVALGKYSHAEGNQTYAGYNGHSEGYQTSAMLVIRKKDDSDISKSYIPDLLDAGSQYIHAEGAYTKADQCNTHSDGIYSWARHRNSYIWNGDSAKYSNLNNMYQSHGEGTYSVNPVNGLSGFYVGEQSLGEILSKYEQRIAQLESKLEEAERKSNEIANT